MACGQMTAVFLVFTFLLLALVHTSTAQNYHYSNGWYAGKKRSATAKPFNSDNTHNVDSSNSRFLGVFDDSCNMSPDAILLINKIVQDEVARLQQSCHADVPDSINEILKVTPLYVKFKHREEDYPPAMYMLSKGDQAQSTFVVRRKANTEKEKILAQECCHKAGVGQ